MFGATIRLKNKDDLQRYRFDQLKNAYHVTDIPKETSDTGQKYGHCAETYPYICNVKTYVLLGFYMIAREWFTDGKQLKPVRLRRCGARYYRQGRARSC